MTPAQQVTVDLKTAVGAIAVVVVGVATTVSGLHLIAADLREQMGALDDKWQERTSNVEERIRSEIVALRSAIPTPEVLLRFKTLEARLDKLESRP